MQQPPHPTPPIAKIEPTTRTIHGDSWTDNYFWLRQRDNPDVLAYLAAENDYVAAVMRPTEPFQEKLYQEMLGRIQETDQDVPVKLDNYYYYARTEAGKAYHIHCRKQGSLDAPEEILLDENALAAGSDFFELGLYKISPNHQLLAYSVDTHGDEVFTVHVKDLTTGQHLPDVIPNTYYSLEWANDNRTLFYSVLDKTKRPYRLYRHTLGTDPHDDDLLYEETDETFVLSLRKTRSNAYLLLQLWQTNSREFYALSADNPDGNFTVIQPRRPLLEYAVEHHANHFYILTNLDALNFKVMTTPVDAPGLENWQDFLPYRPAVKIDAIDAFRDHLVLYQREAGLQQIQIIHLADGYSHYVSFAEPVYTYQPQNNKEFNTTLLRFNYSSLITPDCVYDYDMTSRSWVLKKQMEVPGYNPDLYESARIFAVAPDGAQVPISLVYKKGLQRNGQNPLFLYGYGAYGFSIDVWFYAHRLTLLERGFVFGIAHIRGGSELGRDWYHQGRMQHKPNTFTDFIACAEHVIAQNYTNPDQLVVMGRSAGGLLMGAVTNMRPELFKVVIAQVPFVDAINSMLDASIPLTTAEYSEWGNPNQPDAYAVMRAYSPYENVEAKAYPNILTTTGLNDPRVAYWEPAKWTARLRALKTDDNLLLFKTTLAAGHSGPSDRYKYLREWAFTYAFIFNRLGIDE